MSDRGILLRPIVLASADKAFTVNAAPAVNMSTGTYASILTLLAEFEDLCQTVEPGISVTLTEDFKVKIQTFTDSWSLTWSTVVLKDILGFTDDLSTGAGTIIIGTETVVRGPEEIDDGDMETAGTDVIDDGDMEQAGTEMVADGDMEAAGVASWPAGNSATLTKETTTPYEGAQCLKVAYNGVTTPYAGQTVLTIGKWYRIAGAGRGDGTNYFRIGSFTNPIYNGTSSTSWQTFDVTFQAAQTELTFECPASSAGFAEFDDISCIDQATACDKYGSGSLALLSKQTDGGSGQVLRVEYGGSASPYAGQGPMTATRTYRIIGRARGDGVAGQPRLRTGGVNVWVGATSGAWQDLDVTVVASDAWLYMYATYCSSSGLYCEFDNIEVVDQTAACAEWTPGSNALLSKGGDAYEGSLCLTVTNDGTANPYAQQNALVSGQFYRITGAFRGDGTNSVYINTSGGATIATSTASNTWQTFDETFYAAATTINFISASTSSGYGEFDDISVTAQTVYTATAGYTPQYTWFPSRVRSDIDSWHLDHNGRWSGVETITGTTPGLQTGDPIYRMAVSYDALEDKELRKSNGTSNYDQSRCLDTFVDGCRTVWGEIGEPSPAGFYFYPDYEEAVADIATTMPTASAENLSYTYGSVGRSVCVWCQWDAATSPQYAQFITEIRSGYSNSGTLPMHEVSSVPEWSAP